MPHSPRMTRRVASTLEQYLELGTTGLPPEDVLLLRRARSFGAIAVVLVGVMGVILPVVNHNWPLALTGLALASAISAVLGTVRRNARLIRICAHVTIGAILAFGFGGTLQVGAFGAEALVVIPSLVIAAATYVLGIRPAAAWAAACVAAMALASLHLTPLDPTAPAQAAALGSLICFRAITLVSIWTISALGRRFSDEQARQLRFLASHDPLTGLLNRHAFEARLAETVARSRRHERCFGLIFIDLDGFKAVNDRFGHSAGDDALRVVADRVRAVTRESDAACRLGGDEFLLLVEDAEEAKAVQLTAERLIQRIDRPIEIADAKIELAASAGVAIFPDDGDDAADLVRLADDAMYEVKSSGGDRAGRARRAGHRC